MRTNRLLIVNVVVIILAIVGVICFVESRVVIDTWPTSKQLQQFERIERGLESFYARYGTYPPSSCLDSEGEPYPGAMKLCEALTGQDRIGFHRSSIFRADGLAHEASIPLYPKVPDQENLKARYTPFLHPDDIEAHVSRMVDIYGGGETSPFREDALVLCDTYKRQNKTSARTGMPILYYRARPIVSSQNTSIHSVKNVYHWEDNQALVDLGIPWFSDVSRHPLSDDPNLLYELIHSRVCPDPNEPGTYILLSAGIDGLYGTPDDEIYRSR